MPQKLEQCVKAVVESGKSEESAYAICQAQFKDTYTGTFRDAAVFNPAEKTAISVRDGVIEYLGIELGMDPPDQLFTVYRSPATIANVAPKMNGLPMTDEHVSLDVPPPGNGGFVAEASMIDAHDETTKTTIAIRNRLAIGDTLQAAISADKKQLSLGYHADLVPHDVYDFEQRNIIPHHLAAVPNGRCGSMCSFIDKKPQPTEGKPMSKLHKAFTDAEGTMNLQQIVELATALPEAIKSVPVDQLQDLLPALQQIVEAAKTVMPAEGGEEETTNTEETLSTEEMNDESTATNEAENEDTKKFGDEDVKAFADKAVRQHAAVIEKARGFLPDTYKFSDKSTVEIMRDTLATVESDKFADSELALAFKLLKKPAANYRDFGDAGTSNFSKLQDKEL